MTMGEDSFEVLSESSRSSNASNNSASQARNPVIPAATQSDRISAGTKCCEEHDSPGQGCCRGSPASIYAAAVAPRQEIRAETFVPELRICTVSLSDWCAANNLPDRIHSALQDLETESFLDILHLTEAERLEMVQEMGLRFMDRKKLSRALKATALNAYHHCMIESSSVDEYNLACEELITWADEDALSQFSQPANPISAAKMPFHVEFGGETQPNLQNFDLAIDAKRL